MKLSTPVKRKLNLLKAKAYKNRSDLAFFGGMIMTVFGTYKFVRNSFKLGDTYAEHKEIKSKLEDEKELSKLNRSTMKATVKAYAVPFTASCVGYGLQIWGHQEMKSDLAAANMAIISVTAAYEALKSKITETEGEDKWMEYAHGVTVEGRKNNRVVIFDEEYPDVNTLLFYEPNPNWNPNKGANKAFLISQENSANFMLEQKGILFLHEVMDMLGYDVMLEAEKGRVNPAAGWVYKTKGGEYQNVSFGLDTKDEATRRFMEEIEPSVLLKFNCVGNVYDYI